MSYIINVIFLIRGSSKGVGSDGKQRIIALIIPFTNAESFNPIIVLPISNMEFQLKLQINPRDIEV